MDKPVKRGREMMNITVPPKVKERAKAAAKERGISASKLIERALRRYLAEADRLKEYRDSHKSNNIN